MAGTISPPGRMVTAAPISLNRSADKPDGAVFHALEVVAGLDLLLEPAERLGRHREVEEADQVELQGVVDQLLVERLAAASSRTRRASLVSSQPNDGGVPNSE